MAKRRLTSFQNLLLLYFFLLKICEIEAFEKEIVSKVAFVFQARMMNEAREMKCEKN